MLTSFNINNRCGVLFTGIALLLSFPGISQAGTGTTQLTFTATFVNGTCDISSTQGNSHTFEPVNYRDITGTPLGSVPQGIAPYDFGIAFTCVSSSSGLVPQLVITGHQITPGTGNALFRTGTGAPGFGVRLENKGGIAPASTANIKDGDVLTLGTAADSLNTLLNNKIQQFTATLSCGDCSTSGLSAGSLTAAVTFTFLYR